ncbi:ATP-binding protein [Luteococcus sp. H138]|uniref:sensor histidine kinase n=1 Tax=unclassified Luteococcus TaxID=2639923 RepID=UPI00313EBDFE
MPLLQKPSSTAEVSKTSSAALRALGLASLAMTLSTETIPFVRDGWHWAEKAHNGFMMVLASQFLAGLALLLRRERLWHAWLLFGLLLGGIFDILRNPGQYDPVSLLIPGFWLVPLIVVALRTQDRRRYLCFTGVTTTVMLLLMMYLQRFDSLAGNTGYLWLLAPVAQTLLFGEAVIEVARARDAAVARRIRADLQHQEETALTAARREAARLLHDHVLHALHALSRPIANTPAQLARDECLTAYRTLTQQTPISEVARVEDLISADPLVARLGVQLSGGSDPIPTAAARAIAAATHEAMSNVERHARATRVAVRIASIAGVVRVAITDDGRGFDPSRRAIDRMGVGRSILQRLDDVGGQADIVSWERSGTKVSLEWPRQTQNDTDSLWNRPPNRLMRSGLTRAAWPALALSAILNFWASGPRASHPEVMTLLGALGLAVGVAAAVALLTRPLRLWGITLLLATASVLWAANLWAVPTPPEHDYPLWLAWEASALVHLVVLTSRLSVGAVVTALWSVFQAGGLWLRFRDPWAVWDHSFVLTTGAGDVLLTLLVLMVAQHTASQEAEAAEQASHRLAAIAQMQAQGQLDQFWSQRVTQEALPLLKAVGDGDVDPREAVVRNTSTLLEAQLRDELVLGPQHGRLVAALAQVRADGWNLVSTLSQNDSPEALQRAHGMLGLLGAPAQAGQPITVSANQTHTLAVVLEASDQQCTAWRRRLQQRGGQLDTDPDFVRLSLPVEPAEDALVS